MIRFFQEFITWKVSAAAASKNERKPDSLSPAAWVCDPSKAAHAVRFQALRGYTITQDSESWRQSVLCLKTN